MRRVQDIAVTGTSGPGLVLTGHVSFLRPQASEMDVTGTGDPERSRASLAAINMPTPPDEGARAAAADLRERHLGSGRAARRRPASALHRAGQRPEI